MFFQTVEMMQVVHVFQSKWKCYGRVSACCCPKLLTGYNSIIQGDSLARGPKLLPIKNDVTFVIQLTDDELSTGYYQQRLCNMSHFKCQHERNWKFLKTELSQKNLATQISFFGAYWRAKCTKIHPAQSNISKTLYAKRFKPSTPTLWEKYFRIWRNAFKCGWVWKETSFSIDYGQVLFCLVPGMCI